MTIETMKQALEALDEAANVLTSRMFADAAAALREAIEQAEKQVAWQQELGNILCCIHRDGGHYISEHGWRKAIDDADLKVAKLNAESDTSSEQKPVAYKWKGELFTPGEIEMLDVDDAVPLYAAPIESKQEPVAFRWKGDLFTNPVPLYEHPRQWVGLTDEEINSLDLPPSGTATVRDFVRLIETKLKEKDEAP